MHEITAKNFKDCLFVSLSLHFCRNSTMLMTNIEEL